MCHVCGAQAINWRLYGQGAIDRLCQYCSVWTNYVLHRHAKTAAEMAPGFWIH